MATTTERPIRIARCLYGNHDFEIPARRGKSPTCCDLPECQEAKARAERERKANDERSRRHQQSDELAKLRAENDQLRRDLARRHLNAVVSGPEDLDQRARIAAQLHPLTDGPASVLVAEVVEIATLAGQLRQDSPPDRIDVQRAVVELAKAEGVTDTRAALLKLSAVGMAWAGRLPIVEAEGAGRLAA